MQWTKYALSEIQHICLTLVTELICRCKNFCVIPTTTCGSQSTSSSQERCPAANTTLIIGATCDTRDLPLLTINFSNI